MLKFLSELQQMNQNLKLKLHYYFHFMNYLIYLKYYFSIIKTNRINKNIYILKMNNYVY
jgi:hypothetical protein